MLNVRDCAHVKNRFDQVQPRLIISVDAVVYVSRTAHATALLLTALCSYNAKVHPHLPKVRALLAALSDKSGLHPETVIIRHPFGVTEHSQWDAKWKDWDDLVLEGREKKLGRASDTGEIQWKRLGFNWPLWILFSSGTTGAWLLRVHSSNFPEIRIGRAKGAQSE